MRSRLRIDLTLCAALVLALIAAHTSMAGAAMRMQSRANNSSMLSLPARMPQSHSLMSNGQATAKRRWLSTGR
jgi:hypothetical protein